MAKTILVDNLNRETEADILLKEDVSEEEAEKLANDYNAAHGPNAAYFAKAVPDEYRLWRGMADLY